MSFREQADKAVGAVAEAFGAAPTPEQAMAAADVIERANELLEREDRYVRAFRGPVLIVWGMRDPVFHAGVLDQWRERLPHARVVELPEASHYLQEDASEQIVPAIIELLAESTGS